MCFVCLLLSSAQALTLASTEAELVLVSQLPATQLTTILLLRGTFLVLVQLASNRTEPEFWKVRFCFVSTGTRTGISTLSYMGSQPTFLHREGRIPPPS